MRVLVVEDDPKMLGLLRRGISEEGHVADGARDGESAIAMALASNYDVIALDVMLPGQDGLAVCRELRERDLWTPILLLTARDSVEDRVRGLDNGADDYLNKPFDFDELLARLRALTRRTLPPRQTELSAAGLRLDPATRRVWRGESEIELTSKEFILLETLMRRPGIVLSRSQLLEYAWDYGYEHRSNVVDVFIRQLREKVDRPFGERSIQTVRRAGYRIAA